MENIKKNKFEITSCVLHILAMIFMLSDHLWAARFNNLRWMTIIGRIAYPIFAFLIVEGFFNTSNLKNYFKRLLGLAIITEIPFDLFYGGVWFDPTHQNVIWTFLIALLGITIINKFKDKKIKFVLISFVVIIVSWVVSICLMVDFFEVGVFTVYVFYFFHKRNLKNKILQLIFMYYINVELAGGYYYPVNVFGYELEIVEQGVALLALIPIWLYNGKQGYHEKWFKYFCYLFYPVHVFILSIIQTL